MSKPPKPKFVLHLEALPRPGGDHNGMRRLRAVLKLLLRCFGFRCKRIEYPRDEECPPDEPPLICWGRDSLPKARARGNGGQAKG